jgi:hypothetical protein
VPPTSGVYPTQAAACPPLSNTDNLATLMNAGMTTTQMSALAKNTSATYVVTVQLDASTTNADQGLTVTLPLTWSISQ